MGKLTRYHPVSLAIIRGGLEYIGWKLGKVRQCSIAVDTGAATYTAEIISRPDESKDYFLQSWPAIMSRAFAGDVIITKCWSNKSGAIFCEIQTQIVPAVAEVKGQ